MVNFFDWDYLHLTALMKETYFKTYNLKERKPTKQIQNKYKILGILNMYQVAKTL
jgi:hypothetical protein